MAAVRGVPKRAEKAAAMPQTVSIRPSSGSTPSRWAILLEMEAPNWRAAPSRPAEPPTRWVMTVERKMRGAVRSFMGSCSRTATSTRFVPRSFSIPQVR